MTLHEAIRDVLLNFGSLTTAEIANKINWHRAYKRRDGKPVSGTQINARVSKYPELFLVTKDNYVELKNSSLVSLKITIDKVAETLYGSNYNVDHVSELLIPMFSLYLKFNDPFTLLRNKENNQVKRSDYLIKNLLEDLNELNTNEQYKNLLTVPIALFKDLNKAIQFKIIINILEGTTKFRVAKYFTERKTSHEYDSFEEYLFDDTSLEELIDSAFDYNKRFSDYAAWSIPEDDFKIYFNKLINEFHWKKKIVYPGSTPTQISQLISSLIQAEEFEEHEKSLIFDPFLGKGSLLANITLENSHRNIISIGGDINENSIIIARLLFTVNNIKDYEFKTGDAFNSWSQYKNFADWFVADPPPNLKLTSHIDVFEGYGSSKNYSETIINMGLYHTHEAGKIFLVVPESFLYSTTKSVVFIRKKLIDKNYLDAIISLPAGIYAPYASNKTSLIVLDKSRISRKDNFLFIFDGSKIKPEEFATLIPEIQLKYQDKYNKFLTNEYFIKSTDLIGENYEYKLRNPLSLILAGSPELNYIPIHNLLPSFNNRDIQQPIIFSGNALKKEELSNSGEYPYIQISDLSNDPLSCYINEKNIRYYAAHIEDITPKFIKPGSILIAKAGDNLKPSIYSGKSNALISSSIISIEINSDIILPKYFIHQLYQPYFKDQIEAIRFGASIHSFRLQSFLKLVVLVPSISEQEEFIRKYESMRFESGFTKDEIEILIGELKHKSKGPLGSIKASVTRLENFISRKQKSGDVISPEDLAYNLLPDQKKEDFSVYSLPKTFQMLYLHIDRIDDYLKKAVQFATLGEEKIKSETINLYEFINSIVIPSNNYNIKIILNKKKADKHLIVQADPDRLLTIFELLIDNAFIHGFHSKPNSASTIMIGLETKKGENITQREVIVTVENNGTPPKGLTLEKFITKGHTTNSENGGMGLGGPFINKALKLMGGQLLSVTDISDKAGEFNVQFRFKLISNE